MRRVGRGALFGAVALTALLAFGATQASAVVNICQSGKKKCVNKKMAGLLKCHVGAEKGGLPVDPACLLKAKNKFDGGTKLFAGSCFGKLEAKGGCGTLGDLAALEAKVDAFVIDVVTELDPGYPATIMNACSSGKKKCVLKKASGLLGCWTKWEKGGVLLADFDACKDKVVGKFDGGTKGLAASCFGKLQAKGGCITFDDLGVLEDKVDAFVDDVVCELDPGEGTCPVGNCPTQVTFVGTTTGPALDAGWTGQSHGSETISDGLVTMTASGCAGSPPTCGVCNYTGPIDNPPGTFQSKRCECNSSIICSTSADCPASCSCGYHFGTYLPLSAGGIATCVGNVFNGTVSGTFNEDTGATAGTALLTARVYSGPTADNPCPHCLGDTTLNDGVKGGHCVGGARDLLTCDANGTSPIKHFGSTSLDCPPEALGLIATLSIDLSNTTGTKTKTLTASSPQCRAPGFTTLKCFCDTCNNLAATACATNADCTAVGATICGGKRCQGGSNDGTACTINSQCPGGACGVPGLATAPNQCDDATCNLISGNDGECAGGPFEQFCGPSAKFKSCVSSAECTPLNICLGGTNPGTLGCPGIACTDGNTCEVQTCGTPFGPAHFRKCFLDNGVVTTGHITAQGNASPPVAHASDPTLAALFCIGPTSSGAVNAVAGLPGPGRLQLLGHATDNGAP